MSSAAIFFAGLFATALCVAFAYVTGHELRKAARQHDQYRAPKTVLPATAAGRSDLRVEHREAEIEHTEWLEEIAAWRREHDKISQLLARVQAAVHARDSALADHLEAIRRHQSRQSQHERHLRGRRRSGDVVDRGQWLAEHESLEAAHAEERQAHQRFAERHRRTMAGLDELAATLENV